MKKRLISITVGLVLLGALMYFIDTMILNIAFALLGGYAIFEALRALKLNDNPLIPISCIGIHCLNMFIDHGEQYVIYLLLFLLFCLIMMLKNRHYLFKEGAAAFTVTLLISLGLRALLQLRGMTGYIWDMRFMIFIALALGWICDTFAFAFGHWLGKRKLCPDISPNKTVEGAIGGMIGTPVAIALLFFLYSNMDLTLSIFYKMNSLVQILFYACMGFLGSIIGIIGDLAASYIKRECGIKDFGNLMPGHGGAFDRLDSVLFTAMFSGFAFELYFRLFSVATVFTNTVLWKEV